MCGVLELCGFVCARAFCEERNMRVPKSPFEQLSSLLSAVQFQTKREIKQRKRREKEDNFFVSTVENCSRVDAKKRFWILFSSGGRDGFE